MSRGPGRIERALRWRIGLSKRSILGSPEQFTSDQLLVAATRRAPPWTAAERRSVLRAMHRIIEGQAGWSTHIGKGHLVVFRFDPPPGTRRSKQDAHHHLKPLRQSKRTMSMPDLLAAMADAYPNLTIREAVLEMGATRFWQGIEAIYLRAPGRSAERSLTAPAATRSPASSMSG